MGSARDRGHLAFDGQGFWVNGLIIFIGQVMQCIAIVGHLWLVTMVVVIIVSVGLHVIVMDVSPVRFGFIIRPGGDVHFRWRWYIFRLSMVHL